MTEALSFPKYVWKEGETRTALEVSIDFLPKQFEGRWLDQVRAFTANWVRRNRFSKKATLWMWASISVNLISRHPQNPVPSLSEFIVQFGLPESFLDELEKTLRDAFEEQAGVTEMLQFRRDDGWTPICHAEGGRAWKEDDPDEWIPIETLKGSKESQTDGTRIRKAANRTSPVKRRPA